MITGRRHEPAGRTSVYLDRRPRAAVVQRRPTSAFLSFAAPRRPRARSRPIHQQALATRRSRATWPADDRARGSCRPRRPTLRDRRADGCTVPASTRSPTASGHAGSRRHVATCPTRSACAERGSCEPIDDGHGRCRGRWSSSLDRRPWRVRPRDSDHVGAAATRDRRSRFLVGRPGVDDDGDLGADATVVRREHPARTADHQPTWAPPVERATGQPGADLLRRSTRSPGESALDD